MYFFTITDSQSLDEDAGGAEILNSEENQNKGNIILACHYIYKNFGS
jgi:hypothetical protein